MKAQRTPWWHYVTLLISGLLVGLIAASWASRHSSAMMSAPWYLTASIIGVGFVVLWSAWQVRRFVDGKITKMAPERSVNTLVFAKALGLAAAALAGWYLGIFAIVIQHAEVEYFATVAWQTSVAAVACGIDVGFGALGEFWCLMPPDGEKRDSGK
ncbi:hypothetical protein B9G54_05945 [Alloscardovia macacae]|uniref:DUF3180 domain-containing protein n=1 Tax=Alloscardovia macacae TaxID=1160091 RepID=A0A1Y2SX54_9BIFI|nr:DUF3180 domain-containing protein [Alloscardovia macacae]OTA26101.1 hypothetical protein B9G54_05945 [Alloscardovia macacae]OTA28598.1 hypothetical protein B9T39_06350 [Alloscardovia macacae]